MIEKFEGRSLIKFIQEFNTEEKCKKYLANLKWKNGFVCPKCGHHQAWERKTYHKVCKNCRYLESPTANTLFHKVKFGLQKAFLILMEMSTTTKSSSSVVIAAKYDITQKTAWLFMTKVRRAMANQSDNPLEQPTRIVKAFIGEKNESNTGRGPGGKKRVVVAIESVGKTGIKWGFVLNLTKTSGQLKRYWLKSAKIHAVQTAVPDLPVQRFTKGLKNWLKGIHHQTSQHYLQGYLDEYCFRFNLHHKKPQRFHLLIEKMVASGPAPYKDLYNG